MDSKKDLPKALHALRPGGLGGLLLILLLLSTTTYYYYDYYYS